MAVFNRIRIEKGTVPQTVWKKIKDLLLVNHSVEVVVTMETDTYSEFELRAWDNIRENGSNDPTARPGDSY